MALGNLASRVLVALFGIPALLLVILYLENHVFTFALVYLASLLAMSEFFAMTLTSKSDRNASLFIGAVACGFFYWGPELLGSPVISATEVAIAWTAIATGFWYLIAPDPIPEASNRFGATISGVVYAGILFMFLAFFKRDIPDDGGRFILLVVGIAWAGDTGAYFAGRFLGKRKLYPKVSPKKTWAGAIGGLVSSVVWAIIVKLFIIEYVPWTWVILVAAVGAVFCQSGDLVESLVKRSTGVKDSGTLIPGHGGILDRVDALLFMGPLAYISFRVLPLF